METIKNNARISHNGHKGHNGHTCHNGHRAHNGHTCNIDHNRHFGQQVIMVRVVRIRMVDAVLCYRFRRHGRGNF